MQDLADDVEAAAGELEDAGQDEKPADAIESRASAHAQLVDALTALRDELVTSLP